ncbi:hypothetical protein DSM14862_04063 (plasmid) [Sulfitobacter indolifex]|nr:hypothetical protein DSM14862_04063 [Sulfitobacter indolifex]
MKKSPYEVPTLRTHGKVEAITKTTKSGTTLDAGFSSGTPLSEVTLS